MRTNLLLLVSFLSFWGITSCNKPESTAEKKPKNPLEGAWEMKSLYWITPDTTYTLDPSQPGLLLVTPKRYAIMWTPTAQARTPFVELSKPTDDELKAGFRSIVFNGGSYELNDSTLVTTASIAKVPGFEGGKQYYEYSIDNKQLTLTMYDETYPNGDKPDWFGKVKTKFIFERAE